MDNSLTYLTSAEAKDINGGGFLSGPHIVIIYEIVDVITSAGENLKTAYENGKQTGCGGSCEDL